MKYLKFLKEYQIYEKIAEFLIAKNLAERKKEQEKLKEEKILFEKLKRKFNI